MQRLRGLKQLGVSEMTYIPTTHSRFEHSLGVAALAENILREIKKKQPRLQITEKDIICVKIAGLLHDIGHGPRTASGYGGVGTRRWISHDD